MENEFKGFKLSKILLYTLVGISCFAFWLIGFAFVIGDINVMSWEQTSRFGVLLFGIFTTLIAITAIETR